jgi:hypothetical protein
MLMRREVWKAVGGLDPGYEHARSAILDLCLRARQRDFKCVYLGSVQLTGIAPDGARNEEADRKRLQQKWGGYPHLLAGIAGEVEAPPAS